MNIEKRRNDFRKIVENLDITPTMYKEATKKYENLAVYLQNNGIESKIYPQGSFSIGTVVRPFKFGEEQQYDLDFICCMNTSKSESTAKTVKHQVGNVLKNSDRYADKLHDEYDKCWTLEYSEVNDVEFTMDIVPAVNDLEFDENNKYSKSKILITDKINSVNYKWCPSNPYGFKEWFDDVNKKFLEYKRDNRLQRMLESKTAFYSKIEEIPSYMERSSLQRVIQMLKRHRDIYYTQIEKENSSPASVILTALVAQIAETAPVHLNEFELMEFVVSEFDIYSQREILNEVAFAKQYTMKDLIKRVNGDWYIANPVEPGDNLANLWNDESSEIASLFFKWIKKVRADFITSFQTEDDDFIMLLENSLGNKLVKKSIDLSTYQTKVAKPITNKAKPHKNV